MKIKNITTQNFRTLVDCNFDFGKNYLAISGINNAGKSSLIKVIRVLFPKIQGRFIYHDDIIEVNYKADHTQWEKENKPILLKYLIAVSKEEDEGLFKFIEKIASKKLTDIFIELTIKLQYEENGTTKQEVIVSGEVLEDFESKEIIQKLKTSDLVIFHNSAGSSEAFFLSPKRSYLTLELSLDEQNELEKANKSVSNKLKKVEKRHKDDFTAILGRLNEKYEVEISLPEYKYENEFPATINLKDKSSNLPLNEWGSGTKNRTQILLSIFKANKIKTERHDKNRITPIIVIEEPESFLHPSAQADFGVILQALSNEFGIQTIITTHSPYMLSQEEYKANLLLVRNIVRSKPLDTEVVELHKDNWMEPFSEILGLNNSEFGPWYRLISGKQDKIILVEGKIDKEYFEFLFSLPVIKREYDFKGTILPYEGKDSIKQTILMKFLTNRFPNIYITYDLDADKDLRNKLESIGLHNDKDFCSIGKNCAGAECIEGCLPERILQKVHSENTALMVKLTSANTKNRKSAKNELKRKFLEAFKADISYTNEDLKEFIGIVRKIKKKLK